MSWLVILRPTRAELPFDPTAEEDAVVGEHFAHLLRLRDEGKLVLAGPSPVPGTRSASRSSTSTTNRRFERLSTSIPPL
jgi:uncharacterized protein YciI